MENSNLTIVQRQELEVDFSLFTITIRHSYGTSETHELIQINETSFGHIDSNSKELIKYPETINLKITNSYNLYLTQIGEVNPIEEEINYLQERYAISNPDLSEFKYPFAYYKEPPPDADLSSYITVCYCTNLDGDGSELPRLSTEEIQFVWFMEAGEKEEGAWRLVAKTITGYYIYFVGSCDYTGFDCQGQIDVIYSKNPKKLWISGLIESVRYEIKKRAME